MWKAHRTADGSWTLAHPVHGESCHSSSGAWQQARERYAAACRLNELARSRKRVRLLDIGTGLGLNLAAALEALDGTGCELSAVTLERDREVLEQTLALRDWPSEVERFLAPVRAAIADALAGRASSIDVQLVLGDARDTLPRLPEQQRFDAVFLDPFSPRVEPDLWSEPFLAAVADRMDPHAVLSTYSAAFAVRLALAHVGLRVGLGPRVGAKAQGTLASPRAELPSLEARLARKLRARTRPE